MGRRIPIVIKERVGSTLSEDKMSPEHFNANANEEEATSQPPPVVDENSSDVKRQKSGESQKSYDSPIQGWGEFFQRHPPTPQGLFNLIVAIFTAVTCVVTYWQYQAQVLDQRPWVGLKSILFPSRVVANSQTDIGIEFTNSGKTPALYVRHIMGARILRKDAPVSIEYQNVPPPGERRLRDWGGTLYPGTENMIRLPNAKLTQPQIDALKSGVSVLYLFGEIGYSDIFGGDHCTTYCYSFFPDLQRATSCDIHNAATDEKCEYAK